MTDRELADRIAELRRELADLEAAAATRRATALATRLAEHKTGGD